MSQFKCQQKGSGQAQAIGFNMDASIRNHFYDLRFRGEQESFLYVVTSMLQIFSVIFYNLLDSAATLSLFTPFICRKFDIFPDILNEPFMVTTVIGESIVAKRVYRNFPLMLPNRVTHIELEELDMVDF